MELIVGNIILICMIIAFVLSLYSIAQYLLRGIAVYKLAQSRNMHNAWFAWVPFARIWLFGCISDDIRLKKGVKKSFNAKTLLLTSIIIYAIPVLVIIVAICFIVTSVINVDSHSAAQISPLIVGALILFGFILLEFAACIVFKIFYFICNYDIYKDYAPKQSTLFITITIIADLIFDLQALSSVLLLAISNNKSATLSDDLSIDRN